MTKRKIFIALGVGIVLLIMLAALSSSTPKSVGAFITSYNKVLQDVVKERYKGPDEGLLIDRGSIRNVETAVNGSKMAALYKEQGGFISYDYPKSFTVVFALSKSIPSDGIFSILEAAIKTAGDDYNSVMKFLGVLNGNRYSIPGEYNKEITFNKKKYFLTSVDDMILINRAVRPRPLGLGI